MKKTFRNKFSGTKKLVRKVLSKNFVNSHESPDQNWEVRMAEESMLKHELESLNDQIANLKAAIVTLQHETEQKEKAIGNIAREKEKIHLDLLKTKRSNASLTKQLEDEREYYMKEKEIYCQEMNECKKLKKQLSGYVTSGNEEKTLEDYRAEISKVKQALNQTLEANYNLSIKFLRMKNTKTCLKTELHTIKIEHAKIKNDCKNKIETLSTQLDDLINEKMLMPISPSNRKYLQLVKQNSCLTYENFCLQLELDNLSYKFDKFRMMHMKTETNSRLNYIHHNTTDNKKSKVVPKCPHHNDVPEKLEVNRHDKPNASRSCYSIKNNKTYEAIRPSCSKSTNEEAVVKIYERKPHSDMPEIKIINERKSKDKRKKRSKEVKKGRSESNVESKGRSTRMELSTGHNCSGDNRQEHGTKLALCQVSDIQSVISSDLFVSLPHIVRSRSSPDLQQKRDT